MREGERGKRKRTETQRDYRVEGVQEEDKNGQCLYKRNTLSYLNLTELFHHKDRKRKKVRDVIFSFLKVMCC